MFGEAEEMTAKGAAANRRPAGRSDGSDNLAAIVAADRAFPAADTLLLRCVIDARGKCV